MQVVQFGQKLNQPIVLCLGYFGCMHNGHVDLLNAAKRRAAQCGAQIALFTFDNNHLKVLGKDAKVIYTFEERLEIYEQLHIDYVLAQHFDARFAATCGADFADMLRIYDLKGIVCGFDYSCGSDRLDADGLRKIMQDVCPVDIVSAVLWNGSKISTTLVRNLLGQNMLLQANALLSQPYFVCGTVAHGRHVGSALGFPTANVRVDSEKFLPQGVYGGRVDVGGTTYKCIVNIGNCPTFDVDAVTVEVHIIDFVGDLYGSRLKIALTKYLRPICKFADAESLSKQLLNDKNEVVDD